MPPDIRPFEEIRMLLANLPAPCEESVAAVRARDAQLTKPPGALGRLEVIAEWLAAWQGRAQPAIEQPLVAVFAANHGVVAKGVSAFPASVTRQMVENFTAGGAAINQICKTFGVGLKVFELALDRPTKDFSEGPAMEEAEAAATIAYGMEAAQGGVDLLAPGEMGIGNTTSAAAIYAAALRRPGGAMDGSRNGRRRCWPCAKERRDRCGVDVARGPFERSAGSSASARRARDRRHDGRHSRGSAQANSGRS